MRARLVLRVAMVAALVLCSSYFRLAHAETKRVLFIVERPTAFSGRLRAEIETMGFEVVPAEASDDPATLGAVAVVRVVDSSFSARVELWTPSGTNSGLSLSTVVQASPNDDPALQAVRASEQLRAFFQPLREHLADPAPAPSAGVPAPVPVAAPVPVRALASPSVHPSSHDSAARFALGASLAVPFESGGPGFDVAIDGRWFATPRIGIGGVVVVPVVGSTVRSGANSAALLAALIDAELSVTLLDSRGLRLAASGGAAVVWLRTNGTATLPYTSRSDDAVTAMPLVGFEIAPALSERLRLRLGARVGFALPKANVAFAGERVASWGEPFTLLSAGVTMDF
jgi:hypothetical protein